MNRQRKIIETSIIGIIVNIVLVTFKAIVGLFVNSIAIILDAVNNLSDAMSAIITIIGTKLSEKAPDREHPYGHGRIEYFSSVIIAVLVLIAGLISFKESFVKILNPELADYSTASLVIVSVAVIVKFVFGRYVKKVGQDMNSQGLIATGTDAFMDSILSFSTLIAAIISLVWNISLEGYLGLFISIIIIKSSIDMLKTSLNIMIGERADSELTNRLKSRMMEFKEVQGVYDLALHNYGPSNIIGSAHIQVRDDMLANEIHMLTREIAYTVYKEFGIILTIGIYAANDEGEFLEVKNELENIISNYKEILQMHGFYGNKDKNMVSFDLIVDFKAKNTELLKSEILKIIKEKYPKYEYNIVLDMDISD